MTTPGCCAIHTSSSVRLDGFFGEDGVGGFGCFGGGDGTPIILNGSGVGRKCGGEDVAAGVGLGDEVDGVGVGRMHGSFHGRLGAPVTDLAQAHQLLAPMLGTPLASLLFAVALLAAGQSSTLTGTLAGQVVMEGFLQLRLPSWKRRLLTRGLALLPAMAAVLLLGEDSITAMLVLSQVVLSLQLPFAVVPLVWICGRRGVMGALLAPPWLQGLGWSCAAAILLINGALLTATLRGLQLF